MYVEWKTTPVTNVDHLFLRFKSYEKDVRFAIQEAKKSYFNGIFYTYKSDIKKTWLTINDTLSRNKNKRDLPSTFHYNGLTLTNPKEIANSFNVYFASIGDKLASEIKTPTNDDESFTSYPENPTMNRLDLQFKHIAEEDILIINQMLSSGVLPIIPHYKKGDSSLLSITGRFHFCQRFLKYLKEYFITNCTNILMITNCWQNSNTVFVLNILPNMQQ